MSEHIGCGSCGKLLDPEATHMGAAAYHLDCAREVYGDVFTADDLGDDE